MSRTPSVLIIEDDPVFRRVLSFTVAKSGLAVETANDGEAGYERLTQGGIDFFVTDHQMPRCGGVELLERLNQLPDFTRPPAILCTAKGLELDTEQIRKDFQLVGILHKPFSPRKLSELILSHLEQQSDAASSEPKPASLMPFQRPSEFGSAFGTQESSDA
ncbi:MAG: response regulator [Planctomycetales bacterium]|nr:response regulator [Planctomycetales bacterium]